MSDLATADRDLATLEAVIERGLATFVDVGTALAEIRDGNKHHDGGYTDFDTYCRERWGLSRIHAHRLMTASDVVQMLPTGNTPLPTTERQVRELTRIEPERRAETWQAAVEQHGPTPTAANVRAVVESQRWTPIPLDPEPIELTLQTDEATDVMVARVMDTDDMRIERLRVQFIRESKHLAELIQLKPAAIANVLEREELPLIRVQITDTRSWLDALEQAIKPHGLRVIS